MLLTPKEAGARLKLSPRTIREMVQEGRLPGVFVGRLIRLRAEDVEAVEREGISGKGGVELVRLGHVDAPSPPDGPCLTCGRWDAP